MTSDRGEKVIGIGLACLDQLLIWQDMAAPVQGNRIIDADMQGGGMAATAMVAVRRLGGDAEVWSAVGDDWAGERILQGLEEEGVSTEQMLRIAGGTSMSIVVCVDQQTGERYFMRSSDWSRPDQPLGRLENLTSAGCLLIDHGLPASELRAARQAQQLGVPVVSDTARIDERNREVLRYVDYAIVSEQCARSLEAADDLHVACRLIRKMGAGCVVVTLGEKGLVYFDGETFAQLPAFAVEVVDTTGAGDVFHGAFCYGLLQRYALRQNLIFASATAAMKCRHLGGRAGIPHRQEVFDFLHERGVELEEIGGE